MTVTDNERNTSDQARAEALKNLNIGHKESREFFDIGDKVWIQDPVSKVWSTMGEVIGIHRQGRSCLLRMDNGNTLFRNPQQLRHYEVEAHAVPDTGCPHIPDDAPPHIHRIREKLNKGYFNILR